MKGRQPYQRSGGGWFYLTLEEATQETGLEMIDTYIALFQNIIYQYIYTNPILEMCLEVDQRLR